MNLSDKTGSLLLVGIFLFTVSFPALAQQDTFEELRNRFRSGEIFTANFNHRYIDSYTQDTVVSVGTIWVGNNKYKVRTNYQTVVVDGDVSMVYDDNRNRVIISRYDPAEDDFAPSRFLQGADSSYVLKSQKTEKDRILITFESADSFSVFKSVEVLLTGELIPVQIFALDQADNRITTRFRMGKFVMPAENMFLLEYPEGAEIIDLRN